MPFPLINIIGPGSMGHLWTAYLLAKQANVKLYGKKTTLKQTYKLHTPQQIFQYTTNNDSLNHWQVPECIIICVKSTALEFLCHQLRAITTAHPPIILMMNGMGIIDIAKNLLPNTPIYQASTTHGAKLDENNLHHTGFGETLIGNIYPSKNKDQRILRTIEHLNHALPTTKWNKQHLQALWIKLLVNAIINPLTAIYKITNGEIINNPEIYLHAKHLTQQLSPVIQKFLPAETWQTIFKKVGTISYQTYTNISSMRQDLLAGRKTEIDFITGYILNQADIHNIELPAHEQIVYQIKTMELE